MPEPDLDDLRRTIQRLADAEVGVPPSPDFAGLLQTPGKRPRARHREVSIGLSVVLVVGVLLGGTAVSRSAQTSVAAPPAARQATPSPHPAEEQTSLVDAAAACEGTHVLLRQRALVVDISPYRPQPLLSTRLTSRRPVTLSMTGPCRDLVRVISHGRAGSDLTVGTFRLRPGRFLIRRSGTVCPSVSSDCSDRRITAPPIVITAD